MRSILHLMFMIYYCIFLLYISLTTINDKMIHHEHYIHGIHSKKICSPTLFYELRASSTDDIDTVEFVL